MGLAQRHTAPQTFQANEPGGPNEGEGEFNPKLLIPLPSPAHLLREGMPGASESPPVLGPAWPHVRSLGLRLLSSRISSMGASEEDCTHETRLAAAALARPDPLTDAPWEEGSGGGPSGPSALHGLLGTPCKVTRTSPSRSLSPNLGMILRGI